MAELNKRWGSTKKGSGEGTGSGSRTWSHSRASALPNGKWCGHSDKRTRPGMSGQCVRDGGLVLGAILELLLSKRGDQTGVNGVRISLSTLRYAVESLLMCLHCQPPFRRQVANSCRKRIKVLALQTLIVPPSRDGPFWGRPQGVTTILLYPATLHLDWYSKLILQTKVSCDLPLQNAPWSANGLHTVFFNSKFWNSIILQTMFLKKMALVIFKTLRWKYQYRAY